MLVVRNDPLEAEGEKYCTGSGQDGQKVIEDGVQIGRSPLPFQAHSGQSDHEAPIFLRRNSGPVTDQYPRWGRIKLRDRDPEAASGVLQVILDPGTIVQAEGTRWGRRKVVSRLRRSLVGFWFHPELQRVNRCRPSLSRSFRKY